MRETEKYVFFWGNKDIYSNWHRSKYTMDGIEFVNGEQGMMYGKAGVMGDSDSQLKIMAITDPKAIKALGRLITPWDEKKWVAARLQVMTDVCVAKFRDNPAMLAQLLATGDKILVEASPWDTIWGIGMRENDEGVEDPTRWKGLNLLGEALMNARRILLKG